jgi:miniconductance mechanosensitive channel
LTNIGTFRAYVDAYLKNNEMIHKGMTFMVRQLQPGPTGLPIEIYVFSNDTAWSRYEALQADIFDHLFAIVKEFDLNVFQYPGGKDLKGLP